MNGMGVKFGVSYLGRKRLRVFDNTVLTGTDGPLMKGTTHQKSA
jgi:hypothetical protein